MFTLKPFKYFLAAGLILLLATTPFSSASAAPGIDTLTIGTTMEVKKIDLDDYYFGIMRGMLTHMGLIKLDEQGNFAGRMAESWETEDARTWTFHLREGLKWHDGQPVSSDDVKFSLDYLKAKIPVYGHHFVLVQDVEAPSPDTVVLHLSQPNPRFLVNLLVLRVIPKHIFEKVEDPKAFQGKEAAIGCGPYVFEGFDPSAGEISFKSFDAYYRGRPNVDRVRFRTFKNPDTLYMAFRKGEIDLPYFYASGTDPFNVPSLKKYKDIEIGTINNPGVPNVVFINNKKPPLDQRDVRRALALAIDYEELLRIFAAGYGSTPNAGFVPKGSAVFVDTPALSHDPQKAREILESLGYKDDDQDNVLEKDGQPLELELVARIDVPGSVRLAELLKKQVGATGINLKIRPVDNTLFRQISDRDRSHVLMLSRTTPWGMMMWAGCGTGYFDSRNIGWSELDDPTFQAIVDRMNQAIDEATYNQAAGDLQRYLAEALPVIPLYWNVLIQPYRRGFTGWKVSPMYGFLWEETWYNLQKKD